jgi:hypothetical protein
MNQEQFNSIKDDMIKLSSFAKSEDVANYDLATELLEARFEELCAPFDYIFRRSDCSEVWELFTQTQITFYNFKTFPDVLKYFTNLRRIEFKNSKFSEFPIDFCEKSNISSLRFSEATVFPENIDLLNLDYLYYNTVANFIGVCKIPKLPTTLTKLSIHTTAYSYNELENIENIFNCINLTELSISAIVESFEGVGSLTKLTKLCVNGPSNYDALIELTNLVCLEIGQFGHQHILELPKEIGKMQNLVTLRANSANLHELPNDIVNCPNLQYLDISRNFVRKLPNNFENLKDNLKTFYFKYNNFFNYPKVLKQFVSVNIDWKYGDKQEINPRAK